VPYKDDLATLKDPASTSVNANHPLAQWLIGQAEPLDREAPVLLARLTDALEAEPNATNTNQVNRLLDDLRVAFPKLVLADELHIRLEAGQWK
jgi:predicted ATP-dependent endonuclease of OLD family